LSDALSAPERSAPEFPCQEWTMPNSRIYLSPPHQAGTELSKLSEVLDANWIGPCGPHLTEFERRMADLTRTRGALAVSSGTAAMHLITRHLRLLPGDEIICQSLTFCATANPIMYEGGRPVFIDSELATWNIDPQLIEDELRACARRGRLPRAIVAVDLFGQSADIDTILSIAARYDVPVIEDAAEALGATCGDRPVGAAAWASFFSFNGNKILTTGGGGVLCSNDETLLENARFLSQQARDPAPHYEHSVVGFNYRMSSLTAAMGLAQLDVLEHRVAARRAIFDAYRHRLSDLPGVAFMPEAAWGRSNRWLTVILIDPDQFGATRDDIRLALEAENIESRPVWKPLHLQRSFAGSRRRNGQVAERLFQVGLCLPSGSGMVEDQIERVVTTVRRTCSASRCHAVTASLRAA
jgi:pyridoxal phosphate-dependent aminotransferase EpsN